MRQVGEGEVTVEGGQVSGDKEGELDEQNSTKQSNIWASEFATLQKSNLETKHDAASWTEQFQGNYSSELSSTATESLVSEQDDDSSFSSQFWAKLQDEWEKLAKGGELGDHPWISEFSEYYDPFKVNGATTHFLINCSRFKRTEGTLEILLLCLLNLLFFNEKEPKEGSMFETQVSTRYQRFFIYFF
jgi:hypothetical protein